MWLLCLLNEMLTEGGKAVEHRARSGHPNLSTVNCGSHLWLALKLKQSQSLSSKIIVSLTPKERIQVSREIHFQLPKEDPLGKWDLG